MSLNARLAATASVVAAILVAACGGTTFDDVGAADTIQQHLEADLGEKVRSVDCPAGRPVEPKSKIDCDVVLDDGEQRVVTVEIANEDADFGIVEYKPKPRDRE